jgi:hypothetical protein
MSKRNFKISKYQNTLPQNQQLFSTPFKLNLKKKKKISHHGPCNGMMLGSNVYGSQ